MESIDVVQTPDVLLTTVEHHLQDRLRVFHFDSDQLGALIDKLFSIAITKAISNSIGDALNYPDR